jgi:hypothetical protein
MKRKRIIAPKPTNTERIARSMGKNKYRPTKAQINPVPHTQNPKTTKTIFTTNFNANWKVDCRSLFPIFTNFS